MAARSGVVQSGFLGKAPAPCPIPTFSCPLEPKGIPRSAFPVGANGAQLGVGWASGRGPRNRASLAPALGAPGLRPLEEPDVPAQVPPQSAFVPRRVRLVLWGL